MMEPTHKRKPDAAINALHKCEERSLAGLFALEVMHEVRNPVDALTNLLYLAGRGTNLATVHQYIRDAEEHSQERSVRRI